MSRTRKDRPYWVRANDVTEEGRYIDHDHLRAGKPIMKRVRVRDENGNKAFQTETYEQFVGYTFELTNGKTVELDTRDEYQYGPSFRPNQPYHYTNVYRSTRRYETRVRKWALYETVVVGTLPTECTADIPVAREGHYYYNSYTHICVPQIAHYAYSPYYRNRPQSDEKRPYHSAARTKEQGVLRKAVLLANGGDDDMFGDDFEDAYTRPQFHNGWWD